MTDLIIGVIDCSGSMRGCWNWVASCWNTYIPADIAKTITFNTRPRLLADNSLHHDIDKVGGGGTDIPAGFEMFEKLLEETPIGAEITTIFVSDGGDNNMQSLKTRMDKLKGNAKGHKLTFMCLGVGSGFPTVVSMSLREKYHTGDETLPSVFLIEHLSEKAFVNKFESIRQHFSKKHSVPVAPPVCVFPWRENSDASFEGSWALTDAPSVTVDGQELPVAHLGVSLLGVMELFRAWSQMLNIESLKQGEKITQRAMKTLALMDELLEELRTRKGVDVLAEGQKRGDLTFAARVARQEANRHAERIRWFYGDVKRISEGDAASETSQFEAAKRIALGTILGNYKQKLMNLENVSVEEFQKIAKEFGALLGTHPPTAVPGSSLPGFRAQLAEPDFSKGLEACPSQYEFLHAFSVEGLALRLVKPGKSASSLPSSAVKYIAPTVTLSSAEVYGTEEAKKIQDGQGKEETVNCVLPLLTEADADLSPLLKSRLFALFMEYNVFMDPDSSRSNAYESLLVAVFLAHLKSPAADAEKAALLNKLALTWSVLNGGADPASHLEESPNLDKALFYISAAVSAGKLDKAQAKAVFLRQVAGALKRSIVENVGSLKNFFELIQKPGASAQLLAENIRSHVRGAMAHYFTLGDFWKSVCDFIDKANDDSQKTAVLASKSADVPLNSEVSLRDANAVLALLAADPITPAEFEDTIDGVYQRYKEKKGGESHPSLAEKMAELLAEKHQAPKAINANKNEAYAQTKLSKMDPLNAESYMEVIAELRQEYVDMFRKTHACILPLKDAQVAARLKQLNKAHGSLSWRKDVALPLDACAAPECHFFLRKHRRLNYHLSVWQGELPKGFHKHVVDKRADVDEEIYASFAKDKVEAEKKDAEENPQVIYRVPKPHVLEYIAKIKQAL